MTIPVSLSTVDLLTESTQPTDLKELSGESGEFGSDLQHASQLLLPLQDVVPAAARGKAFPGAGKSLPLSDLAIAGNKSTMDPDEILGQGPGSQLAVIGAGSKQIDPGIIDARAVHTVANGEAIARNAIDLSDPLAIRTGVPTVSADDARIRTHATQLVDKLTVERGVPASAPQEPLQRALELRFSSPPSTAEAVHAALRESKWADDAIRALPLNAVAAETRQTIAPTLKPSVVVDAAAKSATQLSEPVQLIANAATTVTTSSQAANSPTVALRIDAPVLDKAWGEALGQKITWMAGDRIANAEVRLNPPELGPIRIQVSVDDDAARLNFAVNHQATRDAIEQAIPRLREMLGEQGLSLAGSSVTDGRTPDREQGEAAARRESERTDDTDERQIVDQSDTEVRRIRSDSIVDTFV